MEYWYWKYDRAIDAAQCAEIIAMGNDKWRTGAVSHGGVGDGEIGALRSSDTVFLDERHIYDLLEPLVVDANDKAGWRYELSAAEPLQLTRYNEGEYYGDHADSIGSHFDSKPRKLSLSVALNDDYEGGCFDFCHPVLADEEIATGTVIVFPSFLFHHVSAVTRGVRYSLVGWYMGPPFK